MIVTIANAKGGVAKTTSAIYLAAAYARRFEEGATVLDADPQSSASLWASAAEQTAGPLTFDVLPANQATLGWPVPGMAASLWWTRRRRAGCSRKASRPPTSWSCPPPIRPLICSRRGRR